jgi:dolichol-phosphate mannosyltransferase
VASVHEPAVSVVIPAYNEEDNVEPCLVEVCGVMDTLGQSYEVVIVDDGSTDDTFPRLRALKSRFPQLHVVKLKANTGETGATAAGFAQARGSIIVTLDADLQNDPADVPRMLAALTDFDVVCGVRSKRNDSLVKRVSSRVGNGFRNWLTHDNIIDTGCTLKVFRASFVKRLKLFTGMHRFMPTLLRLEGARVTQVPVNHRPRVHGQSKYGVWNRMFRGLRDVLAVRWMQSRHIRFEVEEEL